MFSSIDAFSGSGDHPIKCVCNHTELLAGCCILLQLRLLDLVVFMDVDSVDCPKSDASNFPKENTVHVQMNAKSCSPSVIFQQNFYSIFCCFATVVENNFSFLNLNIKI